MVLGDGRGAAAAAAEQPGRIARPPDAIAATTQHERMHARTHECTLTRTHAHTHESTHARTHAPKGGRAGQRSTGQVGGANRWPGEPAGGRADEQVHR